MDKACINHKCKDPCPGVCGTSKYNWALAFSKKLYYCYISLLKFCVVFVDAICNVVNHLPTCVCDRGEFKLLLFSCLLTYHSGNFCMKYIFTY